MIQSLYRRREFRFLLRFIPYVFETVTEHVKSKKSIKHDRMRIELAKINAKSLIAVEGIKADKPVRLARIKGYNHKSGVKWIDGFNALVRLLTTLFWIMDYPLLVIYLVKENFIIQSPLAVLTLLFLNKR
ncbi:hypothetical protein G293_03140 [Candidatus Liberibacter africanus PTSAPSY]|uniref:Uncharacterized protein n=1 Tax=Candidatus Liberibacter africanus PTSAPSY TaxID=1277257 RepID=A0A0G3I2Z7_LIBAF|nr:hypothetical protein [Candidatus Liberibacter africanus]AKK20256.1 hypothetical protein G293_03140 [Candidatus Liberibacter africanus PTSAPSY]